MTNRWLFGLLLLSGCATLPPPTMPFDAKARLERQRMTEVTILDASEGCARFQARMPHGHRVNGELCCGPDIQPLTSPTPGQGCQMVWIRAEGQGE